MMHSSSPGKTAATVNGDSCACARLLGTPSPRSAAFQPPLRPDPRGASSAEVVEILMDKHLNYSFMNSLLKSAVHMRAGPLHHIQAPPPNS